MTVPSHRFTIDRRSSVLSTQVEARRRVEEGCPSGTIVLAEEQTGGHGRGGRRWESPRGLGLWMTLIHRSRRPRSEWPAWTSAGALAVCRTLEEFGLSPFTKWPNDVLLPGGKVAGLLAETAGTTVLLGVGINILQRPDDFAPELRETATSLRIELETAGGEGPIEPDRFLELFLPTLESVQDRFEDDGPARLLEEVWERSIVRDRFVTVENLSGERIEGRAIGLGPIGELRIATGDGSRTVVNGTVQEMEDL